MVNWSVFQIGQAASDISWWADMKFCAERGIYPFSPKFSTWIWWVRKSVTIKNAFQACVAMWDSNSKLSALPIGYEIFSSNNPRDTRTTIKFIELASQWKNGSHRCANERLFCQRVCNLMWPRWDWSTNLRDTELVLTIPSVGLWNFG